MPQNEPTVQTTPPPDADESSRFEHERAENEQWLEESEELPRRARRRLLTPISMALVGALLVAIGFIVGTRIEKQEASGSSSGLASATGSTAGGGTATRGAGGAPGGLGGAGGAPDGLGGAGSAGGASGAGTTGKGAASGASGASAGISGPGSSQPTSGTVAYVSGTTLYVTDSEGNTVKVKTTKGTSVSKTVKESVAKIHPGESVTVIGSKSPGGGVAAQAITIGSASRLSGGFGGAKPAGGGALPGGGPPSGAAPLG